MNNKSNFSAAAVFFGLCGLTLCALFLLKAPAFAASAVSGDSGVSGTTASDAAGPVSDLAGDTANGVTDGTARDNGLIVSEQAQPTNPAYSGTSSDISTPGASSGVTDRATSDKNAPGTTSSGAASSGKSASDMTSSGTSTSGGTSSTTAPNTTGTTNPGTTASGTGMSLTNTTEKMTWHPVVLLGLLLGAVVLFAGSRRWRIGRSHG